MKLEEAIAQIQKEADFLDMDFVRVVKTIKRMPQGFPQKTIQALKVLELVKLA